MSLSLGTTYGVLFKGSIVVYGLYGVTCAQVIRYYNTYRNDSPVVKWLVGVTWLVGTFQLCLISHVLWYYLVSKCNGDPDGYNYANWSLIGETIPSV
ncbi:hypothetical protein OE88DRAFT_1668588 [Heliocybe sulcata]|uniref:Uncharacterized protein n=1 Tax=Heliocybe sulcata TaxID=5364 RepID=A0A5C3MML9_9AGAM|nr:hypothetical protein OE88DRAFT_1668588 [Heliocybe sulcata]